MKSPILSLLFVFLLSGFSAMATTATVVPTTKNVKVKTELTSEKAVKIQLLNLQQERTNVMLKNQEGELFFQKTIFNHNGFRTLLNLEELPQGRYLLNVAQADEKYVVVLKVESDKVYISEVSEQ